MKKVFKCTLLAGSLLLAGFSSFAQAAPDAAAIMPSIQGKNLLVGFWHNWAGKSDGYQRGTSAEIRLSEVPEAYNVITVSFMTGSGIPTFKPYNMSDADFRGEVARLNAQDRAVLLSLGGADAHIELQKGDAQKFSDEIIRLVETYGFDGLDIDLEGAAISAGANATEIPAALKTVKQKYPGFIISMAPEFPHLRVGGAYEPLIKNLEGYYDFIAPQYYNQGGDGLWLAEAGYLAQDNDSVKADFLFYLTDSIVQGTRGFVHIPADKFAIGLPSNRDAAATGYVKNEVDVRLAMERLAAQGTPIRGLMTWSINWDGGRDRSGNAYGNEFANRYADVVFNAPEPTPDVDAPSVPGKPQATVASTAIHLAWQASTDNVGVDFYEIWRDGEQIAQSKVPEWNDDKVQPATRYSYHIIAADKAGNRSEGSDTVYVTSAAQSQPEKDTQAPTAPQGLTATSLTQTSVTINWQPSTDDTGVKLYQIWRDATKIAQTDTTRWTDASLHAGTEYRYQIAAADAAGNVSAKSQMLVVKTQAKAKKDDDGGGDHTAGQAQWSASKVYVGNETVSWKGKNYRAKWWTQNNEPGTNDVWESLDKTTDSGDAAGDAQWSGAKVYVGGETVNWKGKNYRAKWWTQNNEPGANDVWESLDGNSSGEWSAGTVYTGGDECTYKGKKWIAQWWTRGDTPGSSNVWKLK